MPGLDPISEVSSDTTHNEASSMSRESRLESIRRLRFGPRLGTYAVPHQGGMDGLASVPVPSSIPVHKEPQDLTKLGDGSKVLKVVSPGRPRSLLQRVPLRKPGSQTSYNADDEGLTESTSSLNLNSYSFPMPPLNRAPSRLPRTNITSHNDDTRSSPIEPSSPDLDHDSGSHMSRTLGPACSPHQLRSETPALSRTCRSASIFHGLADGAASLNSARAPSGLDSVLIDAISRSVAEQICKLSFPSRSSRDSTDTPDLPRVSESIHTQSRTSSQNEALKRFVKELHKYTEQTSARGKTANFTSPSRSPATLHTISALLPYRREFKDARLAVTSKDQTQTQTKGRSGAEGRMRRGSDGQPARVSQMDGKEDIAVQQGSSSGSSFVSPGTIDEWRHALIEEAPPRPSKSGTRKGKGLCLPCFHLRDSRESVQENAKRSLASVTEANILGLSQTSRPGRTKAPSRILMPKDATALAEPSPRHLCDGVGPIQPLNAHLKATGLRQPSLKGNTLNGHLESCRGGHTFRHPDVDIQKHNPRPTTTQHLGSDAAMKARAAAYSYRPVPLKLQESTLSQSRPRLANGGSLPTFPFSKGNDSVAPHPLRRTVGHLPERPQSEKRILIVRNPNEPAVKPIGQPTTEKLFPVGSAKSRASVSATKRSKLSTARRIRPVIPTRESSVMQSIRSTELLGNRRVTDRQVLRGLHVATAAACDEEVDSYVRDKSGVRIRQFLADLVALETYWSDSTTMGDKEQMARRRRAQMRKLKQHMRQSRETKRVCHQNA